MNTERKTSRLPMWTAIVLVVIAILVVFEITPDSPQNVTPVAISAPVKAAPETLLSDGTTPASLADKKIKLVFAFGYHRDDLDQQVAFDDVMLQSAFQKIGPINPQTGEAQNGYYARSLFDGFDYIEQPENEPNSIWKNATELHIYSQNGTLEGNFGGNFHAWHFETYTEGQIAPMMVMNIVFDLPSGGHKYMKALGYQSTDGGVVIDETAMPEMLAGIMTSQYMHIFVPVDGEAQSKTELVFWTDSFKELLSPDDRKQANASMQKLDHDNPVTYDHQKENPASPSSSNHRTG
jgi:hypothetical protein